MGREIRRVPANWEHPRDENGKYKGMYETPYSEAIDEWVNNYRLWQEGKHPYQIEKGEQNEYKFFAEYEGNPPVMEYYNTFYNPKEATWWQVYQTVSEGYPVTPPFETPEEIAQYLADNGDFWHQERIKDGRGLTLGRPSAKPTYEEALDFVTCGWAPSGVIANGKFLGSYELKQIKEEKA